jgi:hypothetical protein
MNIELPRAEIGEFCRRHHIRRLVDLRTPAELSRYFREEVLATATVHYDAA